LVGGWANLVRETSLLLSGVETEILGSTTGCLVAIPADLSQLGIHSEILNISDIK
jgi:hypothetical protein